MDHAITDTPAETILHGALELSKNSWLLALQFPDRAQPSLYKGFGCRPLEGRRGAFGGRRPKPSKGGNRAYGTCGGAAVAMGIWLPRESGLIWIERLQRVVRR